MNRLIMLLITLFSAGVGSQLLAGLDAPGLPDLGFLDLSKATESVSEPVGRIVKTRSLKGCRTVDRTVNVPLSRRRYPQVVRHIKDAVSAGHARVLHIDRDHAKEHRKASLAPYPTRRGFDRDEYPPASTREGGRGAHVRYLSPRENRGAGSTIGRRLGIYCDGQAYQIRPRP